MLPYANQCAEKKTGQVFLREATQLFEQLLLLSSTVFEVILKWKLSYDVFKSSIAPTMLA